MAGSSIVSITACESFAGLPVVVTEFCLQRNTKLDSLQHSVSETVLAALLSATSLAACCLSGGQLLIKTIFCD